MVVILVLVVIAGYLVWLRSRYQPPVDPLSEGTVQQTTASPSPMVTASPSPEVSATPSASPRTSLKTATPGATRR